MTTTVRTRRTGGPMPMPRASTIMKAIEAVRISNDHLQGMTVLKNGKTTNVSSASIIRHNKELIKKLTRLLENVQIAERRAIQKNPEAFRCEPD